MPCYLDYEADCAPKPMDPFWPERDASTQNVKVWRKSPDK